MTVADRDLSSGTAEAKRRVVSAAQRVRDAAARAATSDRTREIAGRAKDVATDERTITALKVAGALALTAAVGQHYRGKGQPVPDAVNQLVRAARSSSRTASPARRDDRLVRSEPFQLRLGWGTVGTLLKHPDHPDLWLEVSMAGIQHYTLSVEWGSRVTRVGIDIGDVPKQWKRMQIGNVVLPVELCRTSDDTITFVWLTSPYEQDINPVPQEKRSAPESPHTGVSQSSGKKPTPSTAFESARASLDTLHDAEIATLRNFTPSFDEWQRRR